MDMLHTVMVCIANWSYLIEHFGDVRRSDHIIWCVPIYFLVTDYTDFVMQEHRGYRRINCASVCRVAITQC